MIDIIMGYVWKFLLIVFLVRILYRLIKDSIGLVNYLRAGVYDGQIVKCLGTLEESSYISGRSSLYHTFEKYCVAYNFEGQWLKGDVLTVKRNLQVGDPLKIHVLNHNGVPEIQTDTCGKKVGFFAGIILFSVAATVALVAFTSFFWT